MLRKVANYPGIIKVKIRKLGERLVSYLPGNLSYGIYLYVKNLRSEKGAALFVYDGIVTVGYKALTGKFKAVYLVFKPVSIYNNIVLYYIKLLFVKRRR